MKCVLVVVSVIAVFAAESRDLQQPLDGPFPEDPEATNTGQESKNNQNKPVLPGDRSLTAESKNLQNGPLDQESSDGNDEQQSYDQHFIEEGNGIDAAQLRGKQQNKILKQIAKDLGNIKEEVQSIRDNQNELKDELQTAMKSINGCNVTDGFFYAPGTGISQCLKAFVDRSRNWTDAAKKCTDEGDLVLARPYNAIALRHYLQERYVGFGAFWLGARSDGKDFLWTPDRPGPDNKLRNDSSLWWPYYPGRWVKDKGCLRLLTRPDYPDRPYASYECAYNYFIVCEKLL